MFVSRTPMRVSLFGGGTDYPSYFERKPGAVLGFSIQKYINIAAIPLTDIQEYQYRVSYSKLELCNHLSEIEHPVVREVLKHRNINIPLDISVMSDLPSNGSGLGSSSAFTVGFLTIINAITGTPCTKINLARDATMVERELLQENVGVQDQLHVSFGGVNRFDFFGNQMQVTPISLDTDTNIQLNKSLLLVHTGIARRATDILDQQLQKTRNKVLDKDLHSLKELVDEATTILHSKRDNILAELGRLLSTGWEIKRTLSSDISSTEIDDLYQMLMNNGAYGAKLCGAGGGGFIVALVNPDRMDDLCEKLRGKAVTLPISIDNDGSKILLNQPTIIR